MFPCKQDSKPAEYMTGFAFSEPQIFPCIQPFTLCLVSGNSAVLGLLRDPQCDVLINSSPDERGSFLIFASDA
jgi:hypothetical protein